MASTGFRFDVSARSYLPSETAVLAVVVAAVAAVSAIKSCSSKPSPKAHLMFPYDHPTISFTMQKIPFTVIGIFTLTFTKHSELK